MKDLAKQTFVKELLRSLALIRKRPSLLVIASIIDAVFFVAWGFFAAPISDQIAANAVLIGNKVSPLLAADQTGILYKLFEDPIRQHTGRLFIMIVLYFVILYLVYVAFQGISWYISTRIAEKKHEFKRYVLGFAKINVLWLALFVVYKLLDVVLGLRRILIDKFAPGTLNIAGGLLAIVLFLLVIAAAFSYPDLRAKTILRIPWKTTVPTVIIAISIYLAAQFFLDHIGKINVDLALLIGIGVIFPIITLIKVYITRIAKHARTHD